MTTNNRRFPAEWENQQGILLCFIMDETGQENTKRFNGLIEFIKKVANETVFLVVLTIN
jgi:agmatine deiminase